MKKMLFFYTLADSKDDQIFEVTTETPRTHAKPHTDQSVSSFYSRIKITYLITSQRKG